MKKFAKMSLVAAVAVAGLTNVSASSLEDAVKNTEVSGKVYVEFLNLATNTTGGSSAGQTDLDFDVTFSSKVNDNVTSVVTLESDTNYGEAALTTDSAVNLDTIKFVYTKNALTANAGRFSSVSPTMDGSKMEGVNATYKLGAASVFGAYSINNATTLGDFGEVALMGSVADVNLEAWFSSYSFDSDATSVDMGKTFTLAASTTIEAVNLSARYAKTDFITTGRADGSTLRLDASTAVSGITLAGTYVTTDKDGGKSAVDDDAAANGWELSQLSLSDLTTAGTAADVSVWSVSATMPVETMTYQVAYASADADTADADATELRFRATHAMSSNFSVMATYSMYEQDRAGAEFADQDSSRIEFKYSF